MLSVMNSHLLVHHESDSKVLSSPVHPSPLQTLIFGGAQLLLSQLPNLEEAKWSSLVAAVASIG